MDATEDNPCWLFVTTVHGQGDRYTRHIYECAQAAPCLRNIIMHPASHHMSDIAVSHIRNCPITKEDMFGQQTTFLDQTLEA